MLAAIEKKCREHCGMLKAWEDGFCHAEGICPLYPWSPIAVVRARIDSPASEDIKTNNETFDDL